MEYLFEANFANGGNVEIVLKNKEGEIIEHLAGFNEIFDVFITKNVKTRTTNEPVLRWFNSNFKNWIKNEAPGYNDHGNYIPEKKFMDAVYPKLEDVIEDLQSDFDDMSEEEIMDAFPEYIRKNPVGASIFAGGRRFRLVNVTAKLSGELIDYLNAVVINQEQRNQLVMPDQFFARDLSKIPAATAIENAHGYHVYLKRMGEKITRDQLKQLYAGLRKDVDYEVVQKFADGSRIVRALTARYTELEGKAMKHCVATYGRRVESGTERIYSLQDDEGLPVCTFELSGNDKEIRQVKGPHNGPVHNVQYQDNAIEFLQQGDRKFISSGYGSTDYKLIGMKSPDLKNVKKIELKNDKKLDEGFFKRRMFENEVLDAEDDDTPKRPTRTKTDNMSSFRNMNFGSRTDRLPSERRSSSSDDESSEGKGWREKAMKLHQASSSETEDAMKGVQLDRQSLIYLMNMDLSGLTDEPRPPRTDVSVPQYDITKPKAADLPAVLANALKVAGMQNPKWHMVRNLPGYMSAGIRAIGRQVFRPFTSTEIEDIQVIANVNGSGPNTSAELNAVANFLVKFGTKNSDAAMHFHDRIPGYSAEMKVFTFANYTFLVVKDHAGQYIYSWPSTDNKVATDDDTLKIE